MDHFRECFDRQVAATDELLRNFLTGPAPKEEEMEHIDQMYAEVRAAANATLDRLREVVPEGDDNPEEWPYGNGPGCVRRVQAILYPPETTP